MQQGQLYDRDKLLQQLGRTAAGERKESAGGNDTPSTQNTSESQQNPHLQAQLDQKRALDVYREYQNNMKLCDGLKSKILKGIQAGTDVYTLLYWALDAVSRATHDTLFLDQSWSDIRLIHGRALGERGPLKQEMTAAKERLEKIKNAIEREQDSGARSRMQAAIRAHEQLLTRLEGRAG